MVESITVDYRNDPQVVSGDQPLSLTHQGSKFGGDEASNSFLSTREKQSRSNNDYGSFEIPKAAEKAELGEDELTPTFDAIIEAHPEIIKFNKPTSGLLQLREVQELAWDDQLRFRGYVIEKRCLQMKEKRED